VLLRESQGQELLLQDQIADTGVPESLPMRGTHSIGAFARTVLGPSFSATHGFAP
jgi:hypothetical protein